MLQHVIRYEARPEAETGERGAWRVERVDSANVPGAVV
jgi:hypothetical protein